MPRHSLIYLLFLSILISCTNAKEDKFLIKSKEANDGIEYTLTIDSIKIPRESVLNTNYFTYSVFNKNDVDYLFGYNAGTSTIDIINLTKRINYKQLHLSRDTSIFQKLDKQDLDKGKSITDIAIISFDSIMLNYSNRKLILLDTSMLIKNNIDLDNLSNQNGVSGKAISYSHNFKWVFHKGGLLFNQIYADNNWGQKTPMVSSLNISTGKLSLIPIPYSDYLYQIKGRAGFLTSVLTSEFQKDGLLTYSFLGESNIYQYDPKNATITSYGATASKGKNLVDSMEYTGDDVKMWNIHNIENTQFLNVMYDKYRHLYYRFSLRNIPYKNGKYFAATLDKPLTLMVFNEKFEVIKELDMPQDLYAASTWFITKEGLFISPTNQKNTYSDPNHLRFHIIKLTKNSQ